MKNESRTSTLTLKDWVALFFSAGALVLSVLGFYFSNFRVDDSLQARVTDIDLRREPAPHTEDKAALDSDDEPASDAELNYAVARVVFINAGNRPALVLGAGYMMTDPRYREKRGGFGAPAHVPKDTWPMIIQPRDIRLVDLGIPIKHLADNLALGAPVSKPSLLVPGKSAEFNAAINFSAVDSRGQRHDATSEPFARIEVHETGPLAGIGPLNQKPYPVTSLFQSR